MLNVNLDLEVEEGCEITAQYSSVAGEHIAVTLRDLSKNDITKSTTSLRFSRDQASDLFAKLAKALVVFDSQE